MSNQRKKTYVDKNVQGAILMRLVMHWSLFLIAGAAFLYFIELLGPAPHEAGKNVLNRHAPTVLVVLALAPIFLRDLSRLTNRFAGPMVRLRAALRELAEGGDVAPIKFRDHDFWKEIADDFNRVLERVQTTSNDVEHDDDVKSTELIESESIHA